MNAYPQGPPPGRSDRTTEYHCCGVLLSARPGTGSALRTVLAAWPGVDVHAVDRDRLILTVEDSGPDRCIDTITELQRMDGVLAASIVYQHTEPEVPRQEFAP